MTATPLLRCLACGADTLKPYFDLGVVPLANSFVPIPEERSAVIWEDYELGLNVCTTCWHSQQKVAVDPHVLYDNYPYVSGTSETLRRYFADFVHRVERDFLALYGPVPHLRVLDIACNDGSLLVEFENAGHCVFGIDPAANVVEMAHENGIPVRTSFWDEDAAAMLEKSATPKFDVIVAMNVLGHTADPLQFLTLAKQVLAPGGRIYVQTSQASMVSDAQFDTVYHEHISFFTMSSFQALCDNAGLFIENVDIVGIHGGSYLLTLTQDPEAPLDSFVGSYRKEEAQGLYDTVIYDAFQNRVRATVDLVAQVIPSYALGRKVVAYGAAAKAMTFMHALSRHMARSAHGLVSETPFKDDGWQPGDKPKPYAYFVDDNPLKQNTLCPGSNVPVFAPDALAAEPRDLLIVITSWNFADEIKARVKAMRPNRKDRFLTYYPQLSVTE